MNINKNVDFIKSLGLFDSTMIVAGSMIGSGVFIVSADIARQVNSGWLLLLVWLLTGIMTIIGALSFAELAAAMPKAGGVYVYLKEAWNELTGFAFGWTLLLVIQTGTIAAVGIATAKFMGVLCPWISNNIYFLNFNNIHLLSSQQLVAISVIVLLTAINCKSIKTGAIVQNIFTVAKVTALLSLIVICMFFATKSGITFETVSNTSIPENNNMIFGIFSAIAIASVGALFSSDAWFDITFIAGEVKNPSRNLPLALLLGTGLVCLLYILVAAGYLNVLGLEGIKTAHEDRVATAAISTIFGNYGTVIMAVIILISTIGCNNGLIISGSRVFWAMANDKLFFEKVGELHPKYHTPVYSLMIQCIWACLLCLSGKYNEILDYIICSGLVFYILTIIGVFKLRKMKPDMPRPYKVWGYPYLPIAYISLAVFIIINLLIYKPLYCWPGILIVISSIPVYFIWKKVQKS